MEKYFKKCITYNSKWFQLNNLDSLYTIMKNIQTKKKLIKSGLYEKKN